MCLVSHRAASWSDANDTRHLPQVVDLRIKESHRGQGYGSAFLRVLERMPGFVGTARNRQSVPPEVFEHVAALTPTLRLATEVDIAQLVTFLASEANGSVIGAEVRVSGGLRM